MFVILLGSLGSICKSLMCVYHEQKIMINTIPILKEEKNNSEDDCI